MDEKREILAENQSNVVHMRTTHKNAIVNREKQNIDIELDILERTEVISLYKMPEIEVPAFEPFNFPAPVQPEIDLDVLYNKAKELKSLMAIYAHRNKCSVTKLLQQK